MPSLVLATELIGIATCLRPHRRVTGVDDQALDKADVTVVGVDLLAAAHGYLTHGDPVEDDGLCDVRQADA
ncbi:MAG TPA: hypothetical protein VN969_24625, partial [Streptosporangiaceae bacterium]|nr:hypothetical protein [Streptosporangiaceae bacterium]